MNVPDSLTRGRLVLLAHLFVGLGLVGLGAYRLYAFGTVLPAAVNVGIGLIVAGVGYRLSKLA